ncbi:MAG: monofunctional biosynthetic peptidoglycan transglycosylase [Paracoccaceae bacterium]|jgi:monofunctional biosynthetic peptidoglycan transglycosylase
MRTACLFLRKSLALRLTLERLELTVAARKSKTIPGCVRPYLLTIWRYFKPPSLASLPVWRQGVIWIGRIFAVKVGFFGSLILLFIVINPPSNIYMTYENWRNGGISHHWVQFDAIAPVAARSVVAAEDANYCLHWGFDMKAIRQALAKGGKRGASTLSQQVVKNVFLWQGRSWLRKALEATLTPMIELFWSKRRILEIYLNIAEFDDGVFGIEAAAEHYFGISAAKLSSLQAARLAAVLPNPKERNAVKPTTFLRKRTAKIIQGAETINQDGRAACFQN